MIEPWTREQAKRWPMETSVAVSAALDRDAVETLSDREVRESLAAALAEVAPFFVTARGELCGLDEKCEPIRDGTGSPMTALVIGFHSLPGRNPPAALYVNREMETYLIEQALLATLSSVALLAMPLRFCGIPVKTDCDSPPL